MNVLVVRSRRKTISLKVTPKGEAVLSVPEGYPESEIEAFLERHRRWLERRIAERESSPALSLEDGATVTLFGASYTVSCGRARLDGARIALPEEGRERAFIRLVKAHAFGYMSELTSRIARLHGFSYTKVRIGFARGRWGSCNVRREIAYSFRIAFLPAPLAEYVAVHELCHTRHLDHSPAFWQEVGIILPDWKERRRELKKYAYRLNDC